MDKMIGKKYGKLTIVGFSHKKNRSNYWLCKCDCGKETTRSTGELNRGRSLVPSCGCYRPLNDLSGKKFFKLNIISFSHRDKNSKPHWLCKCDCGNQKIISSESFKRGLSKSCGKCSRRSNPLDRFMKKFEKTDYCWNWKGFVNPSGYGTFFLKNRSMVAHRASWILHNYKIPDGMMICHKCDNKICVNPNHLYVGTAKDNARDFLERGEDPIGPRKYKGSPGEKNCKAKLSEEQVKYIKFLCENGFKKIEIAKFFMVHPTTIKRINNGKGWQCILST